MFQLPATQSYCGYSELEKIVERFMNDNGLVCDSHMTAVVSDGFLWINDRPVERIAPKRASGKHDFAIEHAEGKCIR